MGVSSGFHPCVNEGFALLECYAALISSHRRFGTAYRSHLQGSSSGNNLSVSSSKVLLDAWRWKSEDLKLLDVICRHKIYSNKSKAEIFDRCNTGTL